VFPVNFAQLAETDADAAASWYDNRAIQKNPLTPARYKNGSKVRKKSLDVFPYKIFYIFSNKEIFVLAINHHKRSAKYIGRRLK